MDQQWIANRFQIKVSTVKIEMTAMRFWLLLVRPNSDPSVYYSQVKCQHWKYQDHIQGSYELHLESWPVTLTLMQDCTHPPRSLQNDLGPANDCLNKRVVPLSMHFTLMKPQVELAGAV